MFSFYLTPNEIPAYPFSRKQVNIILLPNFTKEKKMRYNLNLVRCLCITALLLSFASLAYSQEAKELERTINSELRKAQNLSFSGKNSESLEVLNSIAITLKQLKTIDPNNNQIKSFEQRISRQRQDLEKKLARPAPAAKPETTISKSTTGGATTTSSDISGPALIALNGMIGHLDRAEKTMAAGTGDLGDGSLKRAEQRYQEIQSRHPQIASHKDVVAAKKRYDDLVVKVNQAEVARAKQKEEYEANRQKQSEMVAEYEKVIESYVSMSGSKYLRNNPNFIAEAQNFLIEYSLLDFPLGRPNELEGAINSLKREIEASAQAAESSDIEKEWMPKLKPFITHDDTSYITSIAQHELEDKNRIKQMSDNVSNAKKLIADYEKSFPDGLSTYNVQREVDELKSAINRYQESVERNIENLFGEIKRDLDFELVQFKKNDSWTEESETPIHILNKNTNERLIDNIAKIKNSPGSDPNEIKKMEIDFAEIVELDKKWRERRIAWENAPKPFPAPGMTSSSLMSEIEMILKDIGVWPVEAVVITDKDWWVQKGEFRFIRTAVKQEDKDGKFFRYIFFRQLWSVSGFGPTEHWRRPDLEDRKTRIAK